MITEMAKLLETKITHHPQDVPEVAAQIAAVAQTVGGRRGFGRVPTLFASAATGGAA